MEVVLHNPLILTDKRLKIWFKRTPEGVRRRVGGSGEVELVLFGRVGVELDRHNPPPASLQVSRRRAVESSRK